MRKYWIIGLLIPFLTLFSCMEDTSAYLPQDKEIVGLDSVKNEQGEYEDEDEVLPEGKLVPGIHLVKLNITQPDGQVVERHFKYYMPISINASKPISLIFEFHGSYTFAAGVPPSNPIEGISTSHSWIQHAIKENCVICFPAGIAEFTEEGSGAVNWQNSEKHFPFVDAMIEYFNGRTPTIDANRIYSTGQSSGAIFSFVLAFERSTVFAAITPRAGQMSLEDQTEMPERAVPVRVFAGTIDETVQHDAVIKNMTAWAERIGGYFASDMVLTEDSIDIENYKKVDTRIWSGGKTDYQIYSLKEEGHGIALGYCIPYMWEFMTLHTLDMNAENMFISSDTKEIDVQCGESVEFSIKYTDGASIQIENAPIGWNLQLNGKKISMTGPENFYGDIDRNGEFTLTISLNGLTHSISIPYNLTAPKPYFEVGDIYYNKAFEPIGVVCWVNRSDIKEAKIVNIDKQESNYYCGTTTGLGLDFSTSDPNDGYGNTQKMVEKNKTLATPYTASDAAFMWASTYQYKGAEDWYLPAVNELKAIADNLSAINTSIESLNGVLLKNPNAGDFILYSSTTEVKSGETTKTLYSFNFNQKKIIANKSKSPGNEYMGFVQVRAIKKVTK